jgi:hypothetical protein
MHSRISSLVFLSLIGIALGCRVASLDRSLARAEERLALYDAVLRAVTAQFPAAKRPPVERGLMPWQRPPDSLHLLNIEPATDFLTLPDTFLSRLAREGITGGICPPAGCRRVPSAITLSAPNVRDSVVLVQASLAGTGLEQYVMRREDDGRWSLVGRQELFVY